MFTNQLPAAWRNYSPGGKRRKITKIPFNGVVNNELRAMGTKRIPVMSSKFSYAQQGINVDFDRVQEAQYGRPATPYAPYDPYMPPPSPRIQLRGRTAQEQRRPLRVLNEGYRSAIETSREVRGWKRELDPVRQALRSQRLHHGNLRMEEL